MNLSPTQVQRFAGFGCKDKKIYSATRRVVDGLISRDVQAQTNWSKVTDKKRRLSEFPGIIEIVMGELFVSFGIDVLPPLQ